MLVNIIYFLYLCFVTLPIYSLVVHMGKVLREQALPTEMRERLQRAQVLHEQASTKAEPKAARGLGIAGAKRTSANFANGTRPVQAQSMPLVSVPHSSSEDQ
ncbi:hypothetical protein CVIRNUC_010585 [Coccomyxa viridis]|uniref:Uncharacterized protein n=1 Tax=Coccomyxa viridis TaxID=1274662 RepID=A0AAV1IM92_9CHLO|nr:hypothetical protein CVIRNUC_010585 [Coccomyxa viridis]